MQDSFTNAVITPEFLERYLRDVETFGRRMKNYKKGDFLILLRNCTRDDFTQWLNKFRCRNIKEAEDGTASYNGYSDTDSFYGVIFKDKAGAEKFLGELKEIMRVTNPSEDVHTAIVEIGAKKRTRKATPLSTIAIFPPS